MRTVLFLLGVAACAKPQPVVPKKPPVVAEPPPAASNQPTLPLLPTMEELAAKSVEVPLMKEALRADPATKVEVSAKVDTCYRAAISAQLAGKAWFEDGKGARGEPTILKDVQPRLLPPQGPVCVRKGETLRLVLEPASLARAVIWQSL